MRTNTSTKQPPIFTAEGGKAKRINAEQQLRRTVMACLLWEDSAYESGASIADRIAEGVKAVSADKVAAIACEARDKMYLRHAPLYIVREMARLATHKALVRATLAHVIQRADELAEFLAIYWKNGKEKLASGVKKGLADAFGKFNEYALQKYNRDSKVKLRDVLCMVRPKPVDKEQAALWKRLLEGKLATPDTWEVQLSAGEDKKATWIRLISEGKLGGLALLRNLRNMQQVGVPDAVIRKALVEMNTAKILPFRFIAASKFAPKFEDVLEQAMFKSTAELPRLKGKTLISVDISGSMSSKLSSKSDMLRRDAAIGLAMVAREVCETVVIHHFSNHASVVPTRRGFGLREAIMQGYGGGTDIGRAVDAANHEGYDRLIMITDEQSHTRVGNPVGRGYMINVSTEQNGVGYGAWTHIDGFSENIIRYISEIEASGISTDE